MAKQQLQKKHRGQDTLISFGIAFVAGQTKIALMVEIPRTRLKRFLGIGATLTTFLVVLIFR